MASADPDPDFIARHTTDIELRDGTRVRIRPITPQDRNRLHEAFERLSPRSRYLRFLSPISELSSEMLDYFTNVNYHDHFAWGALALDEPGRPGIGVARYVRLADEPEVAEPAVAVADEYQGRGLGTALLYTLSDTAAEHGITRLRALVLAENEGMLKVFRDMGASVRRAGGTNVEIEIDLPPDPAGLGDSALRRALRAVAKGEIEVPSPLTRWLQA